MKFVLSRIKMVDRLIALISFCCLCIMVVNATVYTDCRSTACSFLADDANSIAAGAIVGNILLPSIFEITFDVQVASNNNEYPILANLLEVYSVTLKKPILSISLAPLSNSNQINIVYNNQLIVDYGPPITFSPTAFSSLTVIVQEFSLTFSSQVWGKTYVTGGAITPGETILYASSKTVDATHVAAIGNIQNIIATGIIDNIDMKMSILIIILLAQVLRISRRSALHCFQLFVRPALLCLPPPPLPWPRLPTLSAAPRPLTTAPLPGSPAAQPMTPPSARSLPVPTASPTNVSTGLSAAEPCGHERPTSTMKPVRWSTSQWAPSATILPSAASATASPPTPSIETSSCKSLTWTTAAATPKPLPAAN